MLRAPNPPYEPVEHRDWSSANITPELVTLFGGAPVLSGVPVSEQTVLGIPAVWRAVWLIAGSVASLPLQTVVESGDGTKQRTPSFLDDPGKVVGLTSYQWKSTVLAHLLIHGNAFLLHVYGGGAGQLLGLQPVHPAAVSLEVKNGVKRYRIGMQDGTTREYTDDTLTHVWSQSLDGVRGLSPPLQIACNTFGTAIAADRSAAKMFGQGALVTSIAQFEDDVEAEVAKELTEELQRKITGPESAGRVAYVNRNIKITPPVSLTNEEAQWISARAFQIEEIARWFGIPPHLLAQTEKQTSWGTGVSAQNEGLARYNLEPWTTCIQERLSWLLPPNHAAEFLYAAFVEPDFETETNLLIAQAGGPFMTVNEVRKVRNLPPIEGGGDVLPGAKPLQPNLIPETEETQND